MRAVRIIVVPLAFAAFASSAWAAEPENPEDLAPPPPAQSLTQTPRTETDELIDAVGIHETKFRVVPRGEAAVSPPDSDAPVNVNLPLEPTTHRDAGLAFLDPFLGHVIYPEVALRMSTTFAKELVSG